MFMLLFEEVVDFINLDIRKLDKLDINLINLNLLKDLYYFIKEKENLSLEYSIKNNYDVTISIFKNNKKIISGVIIIDDYYNTISINLLNWEDWWFQNQKFFKYKLGLNDEQ